MRITKEEYNKLQRVKQMKEWMQAFISEDTDRFIAFHQYLIDKGAKFESYSE